MKVLYVPYYIFKPIALMVSEAYALRFFQARENSSLPVILDFSMEMNIDNKCWLVWCICLQITKDKKLTYTDKVILLIH